MKISVFGTGYVGLVTAACFADVGHKVICYDTNLKKIKDLKNGKVNIFEPGLDLMVSKNIFEKRLFFSNDVKESIKKSDIIFITVGTPSLKNGSTDMSFFNKCINSISKNLSSSKLIVIKSTVPVGTCQKTRKKIEQNLKKRNVNLSFTICSNPEFLKEGSAIDDFCHSDRIIIGSDSKKSVKLEDCYSPYNRKRNKIIYMSSKSAELSKLASNAFLASRISFINEISRIAELDNLDIEEVRRGIGSDSRIGIEFLYPGCGYGGSCFPKDVRSLIYHLNKSGFKPHLLEAISKVNDRQKNILFDKLKYLLKNKLEGKTFSLWGLSFKPGTNDVREAPSIRIVKNLLKSKSKIRVYDPEAEEEFKKIFPTNKNIIFTENPLECLQGSEALLICTEWQMFWKIEPKSIAANLKGNIVLDGRNIFSPKKMYDANLKYYGIGRGLPLEANF